MSMRLRACLLAGLILLAGCSVDVPDQIGGDDPDPDVTIEQNDPTVEAGDLADVIEGVLPSVVNVKVTSVRCDLGGRIEGEGEGSGVVIEEDGVILTNFHVVQGAVDVEVVFDDGHGRLDGAIVGSDPERDLAVVRVDADDLNPIDVGRSSRLRLGDDVIAIGFPLGLGGATVTKGIVSATDRSIDTGGGGEPLSGLLQTDAAINPGNSGGPLINREGQLVGINTAAASAGAAENIGFAIAIDAALPVVQDILTKPASERAWLGVSVSSVDSAAEALRLGLDGETRGALVADTFDDSPAERGGIEPGSVITSIEGDTIESSEDLTEVLSEHSPGERVTIEIVAPAGPFTVQVELGARPGDPTLLDC
ncbi:MAG TPA: trypsin-like peptidase domain-containing protein [Actinomycetota bacterium]|nr:trypsin-like peptidase domain-containing protein [Actinomycetota bacterium]